MSSSHGKTASYTIIKHLIMPSAHHLKVNGVCSFNLQLRLKPLNSCCNDMWVLPAVLFLLLLSGESLKWAKLSLSQQHYVATAQILLTSGVAVCALTYAVCSLGIVKRNFQVISTDLNLSDLALQGHLRASSLGCSSWSLQCHQPEYIHISPHTDICSSLCS